MRKRIVSSILLLCIILSVVPVSVSAATELASGTCGDYLTWVLDDTGTLTISGTGDMYDWESLDHSTPWYEIRKDITTLIVEDGVTSIGKSAFNGLSNLSSVSMPDTVKSIKTFAFSHCSSIEQIQLPRSLEELGTYVFSNCSKLTTIVVAAGNNFFTSIDGILYNNSADTLLVWPSGKGNAEIHNGTTTIARSAICYCDQLTEISIPSSITLIESNGISNCDNLTSIKIEKDPVFENDSISNCESIEAFYVDNQSTLYSSENGILYNKNKTSLIKCPAMIESVSIPNTVTTICSDAFESCRLLTEINLPTSVETIEGSAFWFCTSLIKMTIPDKVSQINSFTFAGCDSLTSLFIPKSVLSIGYSAFSNCDSLRHILYEGSASQWNSIEKDNIDLPENVVIEYSYTDSSEYHVYDDSKDQNCNICGTFRLVGTVGEVLYVEITTPSSYNFVLKGEGSENVSMQQVSVSFIVSDNSEKCIAEYALTFSQPGNYDLCFFAENTSVAIPVTVQIGNHIHKYVQQVVSPSCTEDGYTIYTCKCGYSYTDSIVPTTGHTWDNGIITKEPTQKEAGIRTYTCTSCNETKLEEIPALNHTHSYSTAVTVPTCVSDGYTVYICSCGDSFTDNIIPATGHRWNEGTITKEPTESETGIYTYTCTVCQEIRKEIIPSLGSACDVVRLAGAGRVQTAIKIADELKDALSVETFDYIIIASGNNFADALSGSYLANIKKAPILLHRDSDAALNESYIQKNLTRSGTVYILGGPSAVPESVESTLRESGIKVIRLSGNNRFDTNLRILEEAGITGEVILICTGWEYADSLAASATGFPILLLDTINNKLTEEQAAFLAKNTRRGFDIIGGTNAVSKQLEEEIREISDDIRRIFGKDRESTSIAVANRYFDSPTQILVTCSRNYPDGLCGGPLAHVIKAPLLLVAEGKESVAADYLQINLIRKGYVLGGSAAVSDKVVRVAFDLPENCYIPVR